MEKLHIVTERVFNAPAETLFAAFANPATLARWWGPQGFTNDITHFDFQSGGDWLVTMTNSDGANFFNRWTFQAIEPPSRILALHHEPMHMFTLEVTLATQREGTRMTWHMQFDDTPENREIERFIALANEQNFDRLAAELGV